MSRRKTDKKLHVRAGHPIRDVGSSDTIHILYYYYYMYTCVVWREINLMENQKKK